MADIEKYSEHTFKQYKHVNKYREDFWFARDLQVVLQYTEWRNFIKVIDKAMPEDLPTPKKSIKQIEKQEQKRIKE